MNYDPLLTTRNASAFLGLSRRWLAKLRLTGDGPPFIKLGRQVRYRLGDLEAWLNGQVRSSTSDSGPPPFQTSHAIRALPFLGRDEGANSPSCEDDDATDDLIPF